MHFIIYLFESFDYNSKNYTSMENQRLGTFDLLVILHTGNPEVDV